jgi:hypothetical protein
MQPCPGCHRPLLVAQVQICPVCEYAHSGQEVDQLARDILAYLQRGAAREDHRAQVARAALRDPVEYQPEAWQQGLFDAQGEAAD